jgi:hypothetical protein
MVARFVRTFLTLIVIGATLLLARRASAGYTHYWTWKTTPTAEKLEPCLRDMERVVEARRDILADLEDHTGAAAVFRLSMPFGETGELPAIAFNGIGDDGHETFSFPLAAFAGEPKFSFVKTQWKPYDEVAVACLIVARDHFDEAALEIRSDGSWGEEWTTGAELYRQVFARPPMNPLTGGGHDVMADTYGPPVDEPEPGDKNRNLYISIVFFGALIAVIVIAKKW